jgi:hypothetical protein
MRSHPRLKGNYFSLIKFSEDMNKPPSGGHITSELRIV